MLKIVFFAASLAIGFIIFFHRIETPLIEYIFHSETHT